MTGASITPGKWWARTLLAAPRTTAAGCFTLWAMRNAHALADRLHWAWWVVVLIGGFLVKTRWVEAAREANLELSHVDGTRTASRTTSPNTREERRSPRSESASDAKIHGEPRRDSMLLT